MEVRAHGQRSLDNQILNFFCYKASGGVDGEGIREEYSFTPLFSPLNVGDYSSAFGANTLVTAVIKPPNPSLIIDNETDIFKVEPSFE